MTLTRQEQLIDRMREFLNTGMADATNEELIWLLDLELATALLARFEERVAKEMVN